MSQEEINAKVQIIYNKFENVKAALKVTVCETIKTTVVTYGYTAKKRKRCYSRKVSNILNTWFFEHLRGMQETLATFCFATIS